MNEIKVFKNNAYGNLEWYEKGGIIYLNLEQCARGLGLDHRCKKRQRSCQVEYCTQILWRI